jgi:hypothetical protein
VYILVGDDVEIGCEIRRLCLVIARALAGSGMASYLLVGVFRSVEALIFLALLLDLGVRHGCEVLS